MRNIALNRKEISILVVEDEKIVQKVYAILLGELGCRVDVTSTLREALQADHASYDLILLDFLLPDGKGTELACYIRKREQIEQRSKTPIVVVTGTLGSEVEKECLLVGVNQIMEKPVSFQNLHMLLALISDADQKLYSSS